MATAIGEERKELLKKADEADEQAKKLRASGSLGRRYFFEGKAEGLRLAAEMLFAYNRVLELYALLREKHSFYYSLCGEGIFDGGVVHSAPEPVKKIFKELIKLDKSRCWPGELYDL